MAGPIALVGGDESRTGCEGMDRAILEAMHVPSPTLLVIPMAGAGGNRSKAASNGVTYFIWHLGLLLNTGEWVSTRRTSTNGNVTMNFTIQLHSDWTSRGRLPSGVDTSFLLAVSGLLSVEPDSAIQLVR